MPFDESAGPNYVASIYKESNRGRRLLLFYSCYEEYLHSSLCNNRAKENSVSRQHFLLFPYLSEGKRHV